jgi:RNA recognition motif-containing protein
MTLFLNNLPCQVTQEDLLKLFEEDGSVKHIFLPRDWKTNLGLGFAFIEIAVKSHEKAARSNLNGCQWMGDQLQISEISSYEYIQNE